MLKNVKTMKILIAYSAIIILHCGCSYDSLEELHPTIACDTSGTASFSNDILPIMVRSCGSQDLACHQSDASESGYGLGNYADVINTIDGSGVFFQKITHDVSINSSKWMPKGTSAKIDACSIVKIEAWLNNGKLNN